VFGDRIERGIESTRALVEDIRSDNPQHARSARLETMREVFEARFAAVEQRIDARTRRLARGTRLWRWRSGSCGGLTSARCKGT
jgi:hypothetical protein